MSTNLLLLRSLPLLGPSFFLLILKNKENKKGPGKRNVCKNPTNSLKPVFLITVHVPSPVVCTEWAELCKLSLDVNFPCHIFWWKFVLTYSALDTETACTEKCSMHIGIYVIYIFFIIVCTKNSISGINAYGVNSSLTISLMF